MSTQTKLCKHCKSEINIEASRCPKCGGKNHVATKVGWKLITVIILVPLFIGIISSSSTNSSSNTQVSENSRRIESISFSKHIVEGILKSPSTATFSGIQAQELSNQKDIWIVSGYVDSQNSFGAMIRSSWMIKLDFREGKGGSVDSVVFNGKKVQ